MKYEWIQEKVAPRLLDQSETKENLMSLTSDIFIQKTQGYGDVVTNMYAPETDADIDWVLDTNDEINELFP